MIAPTLRLRRVLCALDVERNAHAPLAHASLLSQEFGIPLDGLYVSAPLKEWSNRLERVRRLIADHNAHERLEALLAPLAASLDVHSFVTPGTNDDVIDAHAAQHSSDLIVLGGTRRRIAGGSGHLATALSAQAERGVLTVPGDSPVCALRRILLPVTSETLDTPALTWTRALARRFGASVQVVGVAPTTLGFWRERPRPQGVPPESRNDVSLAVRAIARDLAAAGITVDSGPTVLPRADLESLGPSAELDLVVLGLPARPDAPEPVLVERLRKSGHVPVLSLRASPSPLAAAARRRVGEDFHLSASA